VCVLSGILLLTSGNIACLSAQTVLEEKTDNQPLPVEFELDEVVVSASAPFFSRKGNRLIANVSASRLSSVGTALDVAGYIPGITIKDHAITVFGKGSPIIYIDKRKLYDETELQRLQSSDIASVELISNPDARYDAEGRAVVIIKTKQHEENGWAIQANEFFKQGRYAGDKEDISLSYTRDNFSAFASYNHSANEKFQQPEIIYTNYRDTLWQQLMTSSQLHTSTRSYLSICKRMMCLIGCAKK
jgi:hypothetical protein